MELLIFIFFLVKCLIINYLNNLYREYGPNNAKKKKKLADKILPQKVRDLVPESQAYMDLLAFERKLDATIMRKRLDIQASIAVKHLIYIF